MKERAIVMMISMNDHHNSMGIGRQCVGTWLLRLLQVVLVSGTFGLWNFEHTQFVVVLATDLRAAWRISTRSDCKCIPWSFRIGRQELWG